LRRCAGRQQAQRQRRDDRAATQPNVHRDFRCGPGRDDPGAGGAVDARLFPG
jgi:hypothetical protein